MYHTSSSYTNENYIKEIEAVDILEHVGVGKRIRTQI